MKKKKKQEKVKLELVIPCTLHASAALGMTKQTWCHRTTEGSEFTPQLQFSYQGILCKW